jgi:hypothetical protein
VAPTQSDFAQNLRNIDLQPATPYGEYYGRTKPSTGGVSAQLTPNRAQPKMETARANLRIYEKRRKTLLSKQSLETAENLVASCVFDPDSIYSTAAEELLEAKRPLRYKLKGQHWLCEILWEAAELLSGAKATDLVADSVATICIEAGLPQFVANVMGKVASNAVDAAIPGAPTQVANLLRGVVALICSNPESCEYGNNAINFLLKPGVEAQLRALTGNEGAASSPTLPG